MPGSRRRNVTLLAVAVLIAVPFLWVGLDLVRYRQIQVYNVDLGPLAAFTPAYSYPPGEAVPLHVHAEGPVSGAVYRLGATKELVASDLDIGATSQSERFELLGGFDWESTHLLDTDDLEPGLHIIELSLLDDPEQRFIVPFVIEDDGTPQIAVFLSTNTWEAYNEFGGISNYDNHHFSTLTRRLMAEVEYWGGQVPDIRLAWAKPNLAISNDLVDQVNPTADFHSRLARQEWTFLAFLEQAGYEYGVFTDRDLAFGDSWKDADLIVFPGHTEYWSDEMFHAFDQYLASGGHALFSAGNPMLKPVEFRDGFTAFQQTQVPASRIRESIGASFTAAGIFTAAPFEVREPGHWVFEGLRLSTGDQFGHQSITKPTPDLADNPGADGASGLFTLKPGFGSGDFVQLAIGLNPEGPAHMMIRETDAGGWVFNSGSGSFTGALFDDPVARGLVVNLIAAALGG